MDRKTDNRQIDRLTNLKLEWWVGGWTDRWTDKQTNKQTKKDLIYHCQNVVNY